MLPDGHPDENVLEMYCREKLDSFQVESVEDHLLLCAGCQDRVMETESFLRGMKAALSQQAPESPAKRWNVLQYFQMPVPVWTAAAVAAVGIAGIFITRDLSAPNAPLAIALSATRSGAMAVSKATGPLDLDLDARDLAPAGSYRVQVVNGDGAEIWSTISEVHDGHVHAVVEKRLSPGQYYVRIADPVGARREFALRLGK